MRAPSVALLAVLMAAPAGAAERIRSFASTVAVQPDGSLDVVERLTVTVEAVNIRHGLIRAFASGVPRPGHVPAFTVSVVTRDGQAEPYALGGAPGAQTLRLGSPDQLVPNGDHTYEVHYHATDEVASNGASDSLEWNATGSNSLFPIDEASASLAPPPGAAIEAYTAAVVPSGTADHGVSFAPEGSGRLSVQTTAPLKPGASLVLSLRWPHAPGTAAPAAAPTPMPQPAAPSAAMPAPAAPAPAGSTPGASAGTKSR